MLEVRKWFVTTAKIAELEAYQKKIISSLKFHKICFFHAKYMKEKKQKKNYVFDGLEKT